MPALPARTFGAVYDVGTHDPYVIIDDDIVTVSDLSGVEVRKAYALAFPNAGKTIGAMKSVMVDAIRVGMPMSDLLTLAETDAEVWDVIISAEPAETAPEPATVTTGTDAGNALAEAIRAIAATATVAAPAIDIEMVRTIVADAVAHLAPTVTAITIAERPTVTLPGSTHAMFEKVLRLVQRDLQPMLIGPAGCGKTYLCEQVATAMGLDFAYISGGPMTSTTKLWGYMDATGQYVSTDFRRIYEFGGIFLVDEIDAMNPAVLVETNAATSAGHAAFPNGLVNKHPDCHIVAAANTCGKGATRQYVGRNALDGATLTRYAKLDMDYDQTLETALATAIGGTAGAEWSAIVQRVRQNAADAGLLTIVSPRDSMIGASILSDDSGLFSKRDAAEMTFLSGCDENVTGKLLAGVRL